MSIAFASASASASGAGVCVCACAPLTADCAAAVEIPDALLRQMTTCQTAGNEFLRQFWSAVYPAASDLQTLAAAASPAHKAAKVDRMADYLSRTPAKVDSLVHMARQEGADPVRVQVVRPYISGAAPCSLA